MLTDLIKYDLLNLVLADNWTEEQQASLTLGFTQALSGFLAERIGSSLPPEADEEFKTLSKQPGVNEEMIRNFYLQRIPNLQQKIDELTLEFKKIFVLRVYQKKVEELKNAVSSGNQTKQEELAKWEQVLSLANQDNWDQVSQTLNTIPH